MKKILIDSIPTDSDLYHHVSQYLESSEPDSKYLNILSKKTTSWNRYTILTNYTELISNIPTNIQILILQHSSSKKKLLAGKLKNLGNKKASGNSPETSKDNDNCSTFTIQSNVDYQNWKTLINNFNYTLYNFENASYVMDKIIEEIVTKRIEAIELEKEKEIQRLENEALLANEMKMDKSKSFGHGIMERKSSQNVLSSSQPKSRKSISSSRKSSLCVNSRRNSVLSTLMENGSDVNLPPLCSRDESSISLNTSNEQSEHENDDNSIDKNKDENIPEKASDDPKPQLSFPRLMSNVDISLAEAIYNPSPDTFSLKQTSVPEPDITPEIKDEIYEKMDDTVKTACNNDKAQFFKLYDILYQIFEYLYPTLNEMREHIMENNNTKSSPEQKKKKKKKEKTTEGGDVTFDLHTILCCDASFFNIPIEAYLIHMLNLNMVNRDFSLNLLLHRLITQSHMNNISNDSEIPEASSKNAKDKKDKNKKIKKVNPIENGIIQFTNFNYVLNGFKRGFESTLINIPHFKNLIKKFKITKWNGIASELPCLKETLFYLNSLSFLYISYTPMFVKIKLEDLNMNLNNTCTTIFLDYSSSVDRTKVDDIELLDKSDEYMLFLSLQGIDNIGYQPYCSTLTTNDIIFKAIIDTAKPIDVFLYNLYIKNQIPRLTLRVYGIPNIINTKNIVETQ